MPEFEQESQLARTAAGDELTALIYHPAPQVLAADQGDSTARELLQDAAGDLATLVAALMERLRLHDQNFLLAKTGGMIGRSLFFDQQMDERLRAIAPHAQFGAMAISPAESAARLALRFLVPAGERK